MDYITDIITRYEADLQKVKENGWVLQYVNEQTPELCLAAIKQNGLSLHFVKKHGYALRWVEEQTHEICLAAVKQYGYALKYVKEQTLEICLEAVKQSGNFALQFVKDPLIKAQIKLELQL